MYNAGDTLYLRSNTLSSVDVADINAAGAHAAWIDPEHGSRITEGDKHAPLQPLIYRVHIVQAYAPFTMSVVCRVRLSGIFDSPAALAPFIPLPSEDTGAAPNDTQSLSLEQPGPIDDQQWSGPEYILKLYDHRCFVNIRDQCDNGRPYTEDKALSYHKYRQGPPAPFFTDTFSEMPGMSNEEHWNDNDAALFEAWMEVDAKRTYEREVSVYRLLADLQGSSIPSLYDTVNCTTRYSFPQGPLAAAKTNDADPNVVKPGAFEGPSEGSNDRENLNLAASTARISDFEDWRRVSGILIEFVAGTSLRSFVHACLKSDRDRTRELASVADEAVALVLQIDRFPMINRDIRLDNVLVRQTYLAALGIIGTEFNSGSVNPHPLGVTKNEMDSTYLSRSGHHETSSSVLTKPTSRCVAIDFGQVRLRFPDETDEQWRCAKFYENEEGTIVIALQSEISKVLKETFYCGNHPDSRGARAALQTACKHEQETIWRWQPHQLWDRELSSEEEEALMSDPTWGQHPGNWSAKGFLL